MKDFTFFIETPNILSSSDFKNLRKLYLPVIGANAAVIYEYFCDVSENRKSKILSVDEICSKLVIDEIIFKDSLEKLEAIGLITTYVKEDDNKSYLYVISRPYDIEAFNKNPLLKSHLIKVLGQLEYDNIYYDQKQKFSNKSNYKNISKRYQDVFSNIFEENIISTSDDIYTTMDLKIPLYETHDENIEKLSSSQFVKYILNRNVNYYENQMINSMLKMGFNDGAINLFIDFSIKFNDLINCPYLLTIANDFKNRLIMNFNDVKHELEIASLYKNNKYRKQKKSNNIINIEKTNDSISTTKEISINDIFSDDDIEGMF